MKKVNCIGVMVMDALSGPLQKYPVPGVQSQVVTDSIRFMPGGGAANSSSALAQMGVPVAVFSKVGDDPNGVFLRRELKRRGVDVSGIAVSPTEPTPFTFVGIHPNGDRSFIHTPGANKTFSLSDVDSQALLSADFLFYQDFWVLPRLDGKPAAALLRRARRQGVVTLLDECWGLGPDRKKIEMVLPWLDYFLPSFEDMGAIYPNRTPEAMASLLLGKGCRHVVLKMGRKGCLVASGNRMRRLPSRARVIVDATGAGDCFDAGFIAGLVHGLSAVEAAEIGSRAAAACVTRVGSAVGIPRFAILRARPPKP